MCREAGTFFCVLFGYMLLSVTNVPTKRSLEERAYYCCKYDIAVKFSSKAKSLVTRQGSGDLTRLCTTRKRKRHRTTKKFRMKKEKEKS